jgi:hypothetical protein
MDHVDTPELEGKSNQKFPNQTWYDGHYFQTKAVKMYHNFPNQTLNDGQRGCTGTKKE